MGMGGVGEGAGDCNIYSSILAVQPPRKENIILGTPQGKISHHVILRSTGWTNTVNTMYGDAKAVFEGGSELWSPEVETQRRTEG